MVLRTFAPAFGVPKELITKQITTRLFENPSEFLELNSLTPKEYTFMGKTHTLFMPSITKLIGREVLANQKL
jgi:hypothetical protein